MKNQIVTKVYNSPLKGGGKLTEDPKPRKVRTVKPKKRFHIRVNVAFEIEAPDKLAVTSMVIHAIAKLNFPGCLGREIKWAEVFTPEEYAKLLTDGKKRGKSSLEVKIT